MAMAMVDIRSESHVSLHSAGTLHDTDMAATLALMSPPSAKCAHPGALRSPATPMRSFSGAVPSSTPRTRACDYEGGSATPTTPSLPKDFQATQTLDLQRPHEDLQPPSPQLSTTGRHDSSHLSARGAPGSPLPMAPPQVMENFDGTLELDPGQVLELPGHHPTRRAQYALFTRTCSNAARAPAEVMTLFGKASKDQRAELLRAWILENKSFARISIVLKETRETIRQLRDTCRYKTRQQMIDSKEYGGEAQVDAICASKLAAGPPMWRAHPDAPGDMALRQYWVHVATEGSHTNRSSSIAEANATINCENIEQLQCQALSKLFADNTDPDHASASTRPLPGATISASAHPGAVPVKDKKADKHTKDKNGKRVGADEKDKKLNKKTKGDNADGKTDAEDASHTDKPKKGTKKKGDVLNEVGVVHLDKVADNVRRWAGALLTDLGEAVKMCSQLSPLPDCKERRFVAANRAFVCALLLCGAL
jgi:hypothetical protein